ncbi:hypothetical protein [Rhodococcoides fascians]|uniref:hypothetical protein n=1 Tax=Rhodococcoides fascians TaxID=1828 RepID=UPI0012D2A733|nr:hypothetical protein [Rhodococcus fascians]
MIDSSVVVARIAAALAEHQPRYGGADSIACSSPECVGVEWEPAHVASVVAALPDIAIVELPEDDGETRIHGASALDGIYDVTVGVPRDRVSHRSLSDITSVESMEHLGLALLAAARAARAAGGQA